MDGAGYMSAVAEAIDNAKEEIFIADWWLSPEIYMKRPAINGDYWRLDRLLKRKAVSALKLFFLLRFASEDLFLILAGTEKLLPKRLHRF